MVGGVETRTLEDYGRWLEHLPQPPVALLALRQRSVVKGLSLLDLGPTVLTSIDVNRQSRSPFPLWNRCAHGDG